MINSVPTIKKIDTPWLIVMQCSNSLLEISLHTKFELINMIFFCLGVGTVWGLMRFRGKPVTAPH